MNSQQDLSACTVPMLASGAEACTPDLRSAIRRCGQYALSGPALLLLLGFGLVHFALIARIGLSGDEAYYWEWSRHLAWGYYDHPPMVAWLIALGTTLFGNNEFGVRSAVVLMSIGILWFVYQLAVHYATRVLATNVHGPAPQSVGLWSMALVAVIPLFSLGGLLSTPDVPMVFFWAASVWLLVRTVSHPQPHDWPLLGLALGLGMLSKYPMVLLPLALLMTALATSHGRKLLRTPGPYTALGVACVVSLPHVVWLAQHDYVSMVFQFGHGLAVGGRNLAQRFDTFLVFVVRQAGVLTPLLFMFYTIVLWRSLGMLRKRTPEVTEVTRFTIWLYVLPALLTFVLFAVASFFAKPQANWPVAAYVTLTVLVGSALVRCVSLSRWKRAVAFGAVGFAVLTTLYAHVEAVYPLVPFEGSVFDKVQDKRGLATWLQEQRQRFGREGLSAAVLADNYRTAGLLAFYLPDQPQTDAPFESASGSQYMLWRDKRAIRPSGMAWYLTRLEGDPYVKRLFAAPRLAGTYVERRAGVKTGQLFAYYGRLRQASVAHYETATTVPPSGPAGRRAAGS